VTLLTDFPFISSGVKLEFAVTTTTGPFASTPISFVREDTTLS